MNIAELRIIAARFILHNLHEPDIISTQLTLELDQRALEPFRVVGMGRYVEQWAAHRALMQAALEK